MMVMSIILLACQSAIMMAARSIPNGRSSESATITASRGTDLIAADLAYATSIQTMTATEVKFTVPDRNGDGQPETIDYSWTGNPGDPLMRQFNSSTAIAVVENVQEFSLTYDKKSVVAPTTYAQSAETLLGSFDTSLLTADYNVQASNGIAQCLRPSLPSNAVSWQPTRVRFKAKSVGPTTGVVTVSIRPINMGQTLPSANMLASATMAESILTSSYQWIEWSGLPSFSIPARQQRAALVIKYTSGDPNACAVQYQSLLALSSNSNMATTSNSGTTWSIPATQQMNYYVWGKYTTPNPTSYNYYLASVRCVLRRGGDSTSRLATSIRVINEPAVTGP